MGLDLCVCVTNLLIAADANVLKKLGCQGKGTKDFSSPAG